MSLEWIKNVIAALPGTEDVLFQKLWNERRLLFDGQKAGDAVDDWNARLIASTLRSHERLLITVPDFRPHRPAFSFATALIRHFLDSRLPVGSNPIPQSGPVLYFGSTVGIRDQLRRTGVQNLELSLAEVFSQQHISRWASGSGCPTSDASSAVGLPRVVTVYAPADPEAIVRTYCPCWIAVDCGDAPSLNWLWPLLDEAVRRGIAVIAWGQNPLSECVKDFEGHGQTFVWPPSIQRPNIDPCQLQLNPVNLLNTDKNTALIPIMLAGRVVSSFSDTIRDAGQMLGRASQKLEGQFQRDAIAVHWRYLRALESLAAPLDFYEAEAPRLWGLKSFNQLGSACANFRNSCEQVARKLYGELERIGNLLNVAKDNLENHGCPLWEALSNLCISEPPNGEARIILFASNARKRLFIFALLARHNITEDDLLDFHTHVVSLNDLRRWIYCQHMPVETANTIDLLMPPRSFLWHPVVVGLPSPAIAARLLPVFVQPNVDLVVYPHQCPSFIRRAAEWSDRLSTNRRTMGTIARLGKIREPEIKTFPSRLTVTEAIEMNAETAATLKITPSGQLWKPDDAVVEVARIFQNEGDESAEEDYLWADQDENSTADTVSDPGNLWCQEAIEVQFEQGWFAHFAPDDIINLVRNGALEQRYVRSLRTGDFVLLIHGQQRQSLYELIISRVHKHPSIELHLAMIRRWQEDLRVRFEQWQANKGDSAELRAFGVRDLNGLLRRMQARGSQLVSTLTLNFWLRGMVLCPLDPEDLQRVAHVLNMSFVLQFHKFILQAASRLRGLHRGLSMKLNRWLAEHATGSVSKNDDEVIDPDLGLTFGDVRSSLLVLHVIRIQNVAGPFLRGSLGLAQKDA
ncbi:DUF7764 domain-containing protein [Syntrophobacter fumaroxidans]|uniref:DISARM protein DrmE C-terminal domain-containing protein n=1 Tax=Syntrophobacter fumaroxidans (strain DSM 10017 / MPOB) TaxID=335543 RepID=A0LPS8_SYNFM|nr:hypothetical protein [Syntrophobacter fumaroxidans]ABK19430.1 hypothetical protein Sfum_3761 [Syntrophobacter fumaroxidans MPOB]